MLKANRTLLAGAVAVAAAVGGTASAQDASTSTNTNAHSSNDTIIVTGTRIVRPGFTSNSPIATIDNAEIQREQPVNVEELLREQPQFSSGNGAEVNNGSSGATTLDLRGLSEPRTLPLIDGHRVPGFDPNGLVDVSAIPLGLLKRVDVVTGGASAVYGSDAMAGVVNFVLNNNFDGFKFRADHAWNDLHDTGDSNNAEVTMGASLDNGRGNVALDVGWLDRQPVYQIKGPAALAPGASSYSTPTAFDNQTGGRTQFNSAGLLGQGQPYQFFDFNGQNLYQQPQTRWTATALAKYDISPNIEAYARVIYNHSLVAPQLASSAVFGEHLEIPLASPFLTAQASNYLATHNPVVACTDTNAAFASGCVNVGTRWRAVAVGPRQFAFLNQTFQALGGLRGDIGSTTWRYDLTFAHGENSLNRQQNNDIDLTKIQQALFATSGTTCSDPSNSCAPLNILNPAIGQPSPDALSFIRLNLQLQSVTKQDYFTGNIGGDLGTLPWAQSPVGVSFGAEYRREEVNYKPDAPSQAGISPGFGPTLPVLGHYDVMEYYGEALVPVVEDAPFARSLDLELGYRRSDYSISGAVESYKFGGDWSPMDGFRFRAMFQRAVRAPNLNELFQPLQVGTGDALFDPCSGATNAQVIALCHATGVSNTATLEEPTAGQVSNFIKGNTNLTPETANTKTFGVVFDGPWLGDLRATLDYFDIRVDNAISVRPAFDVLDGCYNPTRNTTMSATSADCQLIHRDPSTGLLDAEPFGVDQFTRNIGTVHVEGIDYSLSDHWDVGSMGSISASLDGTHLLTTSYQPTPGSATQDCLGFYGKVCGLPTTNSNSTGVGGPVPQDKWSQRTTWSIGPFDVSYRWRHISGVRVDPTTGANLDTLIGDPAQEAQSSKIPSFNYIDLYADWQLTDAVRLNFAVTNANNQDAPFVATGVGSTAFNSGNTYPSTYDVLGRVFTVGVEAKF